MKKRSNSNQQPIDVGLISALSPRFLKYPGESASLGLPILFAFAPQQKDSLEDRLAQSAAFEDKAQRVLVLYGSGQQFPNDPLKLDKDAFLAAADQFASAFRLRPDRPELEAREWFCRARAAIFSRDWQTALDALRKANDRFAGYPEPYNGFGIVYLEQANYEEAEQAFRKALELAPEWAYARHNLALTYMERGEYRLAEREYRTAIRLAPYHAYLHYNLALLLQRQHRLSEAEREYRAAERNFLGQIERYEHSRDEPAKLLAAPDSQLDAEMRSLYREQVGLSAKMVQALKENLAETYNALGTVRDAKSDRSGAETNYRKAFHLNSRLLEARHNLAMLFLERKESGKAIDLWRENLALDSRHLPSLLGMARAWRAEENHPEAIKQYRAIIALDPRQIEAHQELALSLEANNQTDAAIGEFQESIRLQKSLRAAPFADPSLHERLGLAYERKKLRDEACGHYIAARDALRAAGSKPGGALKRKLDACPQGPAI